MFDKEAVTFLQGLFLEQEERLEKRLEKRLTQVFIAALKQNNIEVKREIRDEVHSLILASESRMMQRMDAKLEKLRTDIVNDIGSILDEAVLPQIAELQHEVKRVKLHLHMA